MAFGFWLLAFGFWLLAFGFWLLAFGFWLLAFGFWRRLVNGIAELRSGTDECVRPYTFVINFRRLDRVRPW